jgi:hypothetical protein
MIFSVLDCYKNIFYDFEILSMQFIPSIAADTIPPAYPAPSAHGYKFTTSLW